MCSVLVQNERTITLGGILSFWQESESASARWAGCVRFEMLDFWKAKGAALVDIAATSFATRDHATGELVSGEIPCDRRLRGIVEKSPSGNTIKLVMRPASAIEEARFHSNRVPLMEKPMRPLYPGPNYGEAVKAVCSAASLAAYAL